MKWSANAPSCRSNSGGRERRRGSTARRRTSSALSAIEIVFVHSASPREASASAGKSITTKGWTWSSSTVSAVRPGSSSTEEQLRCIDFREGNSSARREGRRSVACCYCCCRRERRRARHRRPAANERWKRSARQSEARNLISKFVFHSCDQSIQFGHDRVPTHVLRVVLQLVGDHLRLFAQNVRELRDRVRIHESQLAVRARICSWSKHSAWFLTTPVNQTSKKIDID